MKKYILLFLSCALLLGASGCAGNSGAEKTGRPGVVVTIFPEYDWLREIAGEHWEELDVTLLMDSGVDLHSYQPTAADMIRISSCDLFIYVGGESDAWVEDALKEAVNPDMVVIGLLDALGSAAREEETVEGMESGEEEEDPEEVEYDEHVWLSLRNAAVLCETIAEALGKADPARGADYETNARDYIARLEELDGAYARTVEEAELDTLLFGDRFPFRYMTEDYGLKYYAAFAGCSAETEASFETVVFLAGKVDELGLPAILRIDGSDGSLAETVRENASGDPAILTMDSMQSRTARDIQAGVTYLSVMEENLAVLAEALNR